MADMLPLRLLVGDGCQRISLSRSPAPRLSAGGVSSCVLCGWGYRAAGGVSPLCRCPLYSVSREDGFLFTFSRYVQSDSPAWTQRGQAKSGGYFLSSESRRVAAAELSALSGTLLCRRKCSFGTAAACVSDTGGRGGAVRSGYMCIRTVGCVFLLAALWRDAASPQKAGVGRGAGYGQGGCVPRQGDNG